MIEEKSICLSFKLDRNACATLVYTKYQQNNPLKFDL